MDTRRRDDPSGFRARGAAVTRRALLSAMGLGALGAFAACSAEPARGSAEPARGSSPFVPSATTTPTPVPTPTPTPLIPAETLRPLRGAGTWAATDASRMLADSGAHWYYTWKPTPDGLVTPPGVDFVPMIARAEQATADQVAAAARLGTTLLGFNEPNHGEQANMTPTTALDLWPLLQQSGMRLGAPAVAGDATLPGGWLEEFMAGVTQRGYRVDFMTAHLYGTPGEKAVNGVLPSMQQHLTALHALYGRPIWVTELAAIPWGSMQNLPDPAGQARFLLDSDSTLRTMPFVERYAWFSIPYWETAPTTCLYAQDGQRTAVGDAYRALR